MLHIATFSGSVRTRRNLAPTFVEVRLGCPGEQTHHVEEVENGMCGDWILYQKRCVCGLIYIIRRLINIEDMYMKLRDPTTHFWGVINQRSVVHPHCEMCP